MIQFLGFVIADVRGRVRMKGGIQAYEEETVPRT